MKRGSFVLLSVLICSTLLFSQTAEPSASQRAQVHSKQVQGGTMPGQIPYLLAHSSGDVRLPGRGIIADQIKLPDAASVLENMTCDGVTDVVVLGKLGKGVSSPTVDQGYIYTDWDLNVGQVFKDASQTDVEPGQTIVVTRPGGELTISGRHVYASEDDFPNFHAGEEVLLYLKSLPVKTYALNTPSGFVLSGSNVIPLAERLAPQFASVQRDTFLQLVQSAATASCPAPPSPGGSNENKPPSSR